MELADVIILVNGEPLRVQDVVAHLKASGVFRNAVCQLVETLVIKHKARELGVTVSEEELYEFEAAKRRWMGLARAEDMNLHCRNNGITLEQWHTAARQELLCLKTRNKVVGEQAVMDYFMANRDNLRAVQVSRLTCARREQAEAMKGRATSGGENFADLARRYSVDENTRHAGGYLGTVRRRMFPPLLDAAIFRAAAREVLGPFEELGGWSLYRVDAVREPELTEGLKKEIADRLFAAWLQKAIGESRFERSA